MKIVFYVSGALALISTVIAVTRVHAVHSLLYVITSLLAGSLVFFTLGAPYAAALQAIVYAGAIMVLFIFVIMMLNLGPQASERERHWLLGRAWLGPGLLAAAILVEMVLVLLNSEQLLPVGAVVDAKQVSAALFSRYLVLIEAGSMLLLAGLVGAYHLGRRVDDEDRGGQP